MAEHEQFQAEPGAVPSPSSTSPHTRAWDSLEIVIGGQFRRTMPPESFNLDQYRQGIMNDPILNTEQKTAAMSVVTARISAVTFTGACGTGKTLMLGRIIHLLLAQGQRVLAVAPSDSTVEALTIAFRRATDDASASKWITVKHSTMYRDHQHTPARDSHLVAMSRYLRNAEPGFQPTQLDMQQIQYAKEQVEKGDGAAQWYLTLLSQVVQLSLAQKMQLGYLDQRFKQKTLEQYKLVFTEANRDTMEIDSMAGRRMLFQADVIVVDHAGAAEATPVVQILRAHINTAWKVVFTKDPASFVSA